MDGRSTGRSTNSSIVQTCLMNLNVLGAQMNNLTFFGLKRVHLGSMVGDSFNSTIF